MGATQWEDVEIVDLIVDLLITKTGAPLVIRGIQGSTKNISHGRSRGRCR